MTESQVKNTIGIYVPSVNHFTETIAYWIALNPKNYVILITPTESEQKEHKWCLKRLSQFKLENIELVKPASLPICTDWLYIKSSKTHPLFEKNLNAWVRKTKKLGILAYYNHQDGFKSIIKQLLYTFPYYFLAKTVLLQISSQCKHPYAFIQKQAFFSPSVHPQYIVNEHYRQLIFDEHKDFRTQRNYKFTFLGNRQPKERKTVLKVVKETLNRIKNSVIFDDYQEKAEISRSSVNTLWIEYGDGGSKRGLKSTEYVKALSETDFCICPLGWGGNWTHRVIEALVCGAIPILEDADRYNIGLTDMKTCIVVKNGDWGEAIERAYRLKPEEIVAMRSRVKMIKENYLIPEVAARRFRQSINLD